MNLYQLPLPLLAAILAAIGQLTLRMAMLKVGAINVTTLANPIALIPRLLTQPLLWAAGLIYMAGFLIWLTVLSRVPLSVAYPIIATTYVIVPLLSVLFLGEKLFWQHWLGMIVICIGVGLVGTAAA